MPSPLGLVQRADPDVVTGPFVYVRLLGDREAVDALTPTPGHLVIHRGPEVEDGRAIQVLRQRVRVVAFVNNHYAGYAPETARHSWPWPTRWPRPSREGRALPRAVD